MIRDEISQIFHSIEVIDQAANAGQMMRALRGELGRFGFTSCMVTNLPHQRTLRWQEHIVINEWPRPWYERYVVQGHYRHDPCVALSRAATVPFVWSEIGRTAMSPEGRRIMAEAGEHGLFDGICIPAGNEGGDPAVVTVAGRTLDLAPLARCTVHALAKHAYQAAARLVTHQPRLSRGLSLREREILQWIADGKTAWAIARILNISENTVNTHMRNMRQKLETSNTVHTLAEAVRRGEIEL